LTITFSQEARYDLIHQHNLDASRILSAEIAAEISAEINAELDRDTMYNAADHWEYPIPELTSYFYPPEPNDTVNWQKEGF